MVEVPYENLPKFMYVDVFLGKSSLIAETLNEEEPEGCQIYKTSYNLVDDDPPTTTRIIGKDLFVYEDDTKARQITDFAYEPIQGWFFLDEDTALDEIYVEYYRYTNTQQIPITLPDWDMPKPVKAVDIYNQPIYFDQPIFPHEFKFRIAHSDIELGKILIKQAVLEREFFMVVDNNPNTALAHTNLATVIDGVNIRTGFAYEGPIQSPELLNFWRGGSITFEVTLFVHNFGDYFPNSFNWNGTGYKAILWKSNNPGHIDIQYP